MTAERDQRMTETYIAVSDALARSPVPTYGVVMAKSPHLPRPFYLPQAPPQTAEQFRAALGRLGKLGIVKQN